MQFFKKTIGIIIVTILMSSCDIGYRKENEILQKEKSLVEAELNVLIDRYDKVLARNEAMDDHLLETKARVLRLLDSIEVLKYHKNRSLQFKKTE